MDNGAYILGLNGWFTRSHDASACIVQDGRILAMAEEERFVRRKHAYDRLPLYSAIWCLDQVGITLDEVEAVAVGWDYRKQYSINGIREPRLDNLADVYFPKKYFQYEKKPSIELVSHHLAHAASSFYMSGMKRASILVVDGQGEDASVTFAVGDQSTIRVLRTFPIESSLGYFYEAISDFIGLGADAAGKTMGLAPYGDAKYNFPQFKLDQTGYEVALVLPISDERALDQQQQLISAWRRELTSMFGVQDNLSFQFRRVYGDVFRDVRLTDLHRDIAASAQSLLETVLLHLVKILIGQTKIRDLCLAGGTALNCAANTAIYTSGLVDGLFVPPCANDGGVSLGAALLVGGRPSHRMDHAYWGPEFSSEEIEALLRKLGSTYWRSEAIEDEVARLISSGKVVSWFQGKMEVGPRALGARSILAHPGIHEMHQRVNFAKEREQWRPLAPSIMEEHNSDFFETRFESPFMLHTFNVKAAKSGSLSAIVHVDGSTRPQTVNEATNRRYYHLIKAFKELTALPLVLNTSFNGAKEPLVCTPMDALVSYYANATDYLAIGEFLVKK